MEMIYLTQARELIEMCAKNADHKTIADYLKVNQSVTELDGMVKLTRMLYDQLDENKALSFARLCEVLGNGGRYRLTSAGLPSVMNALSTPPKGGR